MSTEDPDKTAEHEALTEPEAKASKSVASQIMERNNLLRDNQRYASQATERHEYRLFGYLDSAYPKPTPSFPEQLAALIASYASKALAIKDTQEILSELLDQALHGGVAMGFHPKDLIATLQERANALALEVSMKCIDCGGTGTVKSISGLIDYDCATCKGEGSVPLQTVDASPYEPLSSPMEEPDPFVTGQSTLSFEPPAKTRAVKTEEALELTAHPPSRSELTPEEQAQLLRLRGQR